ncbi:hypothetical protein [Klebsiella oxytoca]|nr:hypothetical protein [Klebsiella oxytoca]
MMIMFANEKNIMRLLGILLTELNEEWIVKETLTIAAKHGGDRADR